MKKGKVSEAVLKRSVLRPLALAGVLAGGAGFGEDCGLFEWKNGRETLASATVCGTLGGPCDRSFEMLLASVINNLITAGTETEGIMLDVLFPAGCEEKELKELMKAAAESCRKFQVLVGGGHTEISDALLRPMVSVTGWGAGGQAKEEISRGKEENPAISGLQPEQDLVMTGWIGLAGTAILARNYEAELLKRYPFSLVDTARGFEQLVLIREAARAGSRFGVSAMHDVSQGGIFGALWEMADRAGVGLEVDLKRIPVRQETIEICEFFGLNPYQLYGQGALLLGTCRGEALVSCLASRGIPAAVIGRTGAGNDRVIRNGEDVRFLDRPCQDMLWTL